MKKKPERKGSDIRVAVVSDPLFRHGGAEIHLKYILDTFPNCELYTAYYDEKFVKDFEGVKVYEIAAPIYVALATDMEIIVSRKLLESITPEELDAVLWHELGHIKGKHRALKSIANFVSLITKPMNTSRVFQQSVYELCEIAADRFAAQRADPFSIQSVKRFFRDPSFPF